MPYHAFSARLPLLLMVLLPMSACDSDDEPGATDDAAVADVVDAADAVVEVDMPPGTDVTGEPGADGSAECAADRLDWGWGGDLMLPGTDCIACHRVGGSADDSVFSVAGTVFVSATCPVGVEGAVVHVVDSLETAIALTTNEVGNFFTSEALEPPFRTSVEVGGVETEMLTPFDDGSCGACHAEGSRLGFVWGGR